MVWAAWMVLRVSAKGEEVIGELVLTASMNSRCLAAKPAKTWN